MSDIATGDEIFFGDSELDRATAERIAAEALAGADDGELYLEHRLSESFAFDDGRMKSASFDTARGFGLRAVSGEQTGYAHASDISAPAMRRAAETVRAVRQGSGGTMSIAPVGTNRTLYTDVNPLNEIPFADKVALLEAVDAYGRAKDPRVVQVSASLAGSWQAVEIIRADGARAGDIRPLVRFNVSVVVAKGDRRESGSHGEGGRVGYGFYMQPQNWQRAVDEALRQALVNLESVAAPAGEQTVVLASGWPGILLHEAIGHGLEGDFNRKKTSVFSGLLGEQVAARGITVVDDGTIPDRRGSLTVDDEGTPSGRTVLIEDGILKGYMQDRMNARLMGMAATGNGRRESFGHMPMPRMTNTYMMAGDRDPGEIIASVKNGLYAVNFGGGQVDITSGKFVFSCTEAYRIENGQIREPVKGATLIGTGNEVLKKVTAVGNDMALDPGVGTCGKGGQSVPVGVGQPTLKVEGLTVGGTAA
ncbi:metalloprotease TldD [Oceanibacterium hippocampi]|uniref:Protease TldD n=1 Tax=Oceanibacterium hippocampi TaxID=745714 RepID=A0A1Y5S9R8_9PROT|nr:metalloprotease TldD [Oceanibacterium hippocampi]SLN33225.1 protease TldD [Oceanibacterium hippocampi]